MSKLSETTIETPVWEGKAYLTRREAAAYLRISLETFREWSKLFNLKRMKRGNVVRYSVGEVVRLRDRLTEKDR